MRRRAGIASWTIHNRIKRTNFSFLEEGCESLIYAALHFFNSWMRKKLVEKLAGNLLENFVTKIVQFVRNTTLVTKYFEFALSSKLRMPSSQSSKPVLGSLHWYDLRLHFYCWVKEGIEFIWRKTGYFFRMSEIISKSSLLLNNQKSLVRTEYSMISPSMSYQHNRCYTRQGI